MFKRPFNTGNRVDKPVRLTKKSFTQQAKLKMQQRIESQPQSGRAMDYGTSPRTVLIEPRNLVSAIVTLVVGRDARIFACHEDVLSMSPFFATALRTQSYSDGAKTLELPDEEPEIFSSVLEYLYKGDYYPRLLHDPKRNTWLLESEGGKNPLGHYSAPATLYHHGVGGVLLKDSVIYCTADKFGLEDLKRVALRKQGLQTGIPVDVILRTARFAYENTPDQDAKLRAHFLALIIRSRKTFKRSGTMQMEMEMGGSKLYFDLFVAMCNHIDDIVDMTNKGTPRTI